MESNGHATGNTHRKPKQNENENMPPGEGQRNTKPLNKMEIQDSMFCDGIKKNKTTWGPESNRNVIPSARGGTSIRCIIPCNISPLGFFSQLTIPRPSTWTAAFHARLETVPEVDGNADSRPRQERGAGRGGKGAAAAGGCCNPATDGVYVYVWEASTKRVHKVANVWGIFLCHRLDVDS